MLDPFLPRLDGKKQLQRSVALYLDNLMQKWQPGCKKADFFRAITRVRFNGPEHDVVDPQIDWIKKADRRLRRGKLPLTISWVVDNVGSLHDITSEDDFDTVLYLIPFINMFDYVQRKLLSEGTSSDMIISQFARYNEHRIVVEVRYDDFKRTGRVSNTSKGQ